MTPTVSIINCLYIVVHLYLSDSLILIKWGLILVWGSEYIQNVKIIKLRVQTVVPVKNSFVVFTTIN